MSLRCHTFSICLFHYIGILWKGSGVCLHLSVVNQTDMTISCHFQGGHTLVRTCAPPGFFEGSQCLERVTFFFRKGSLFWQFSEGSHSTIRKVCKGRQRKRLWKRLWKPVWDVERCLGVSVSLRVCESVSLCVCVCAFICLCMCVCLTCTVTKYHQHEPC